MTDTGVLRVHLSHALNLRSRDANGASDPHVQLQLGKNKATQKMGAKGVCMLWVVISGG